MIYTPHTSLVLLLNDQIIEPILRRTDYCSKAFSAHGTYPNSNPMASWSHRISGLSVTTFATTSFIYCRSHWHHDLSRVRRGWSPCCFTDTSTAREYYTLLPFSSGDLVWVGGSAFPAVWILRTRTQFMVIILNPNCRRQTKPHSSSPTFSR